MSSGWIGASRRTTHTADVRAPAAAPATFAQLLLKPTTEAALLRLGYAAPSPVQASAIPAAKFGLDIIVQAKSGTGKTLVFAIVALELLDGETRHAHAAAQVLVVCPTREIAQQAQLVIAALAEGRTDVRVELVIGGMYDRKLAQRLSQANVVVATPGKLLDLLGQGALPLNTLKLLVLDEADTLASAPFWDQTSTIIQYCVADAKPQVLALSATWTPQERQTLEKLIGRPLQEISTITNGQWTLHGVAQFVRIGPSPAWKVVQVRALLDQLSFQQILIFCNHRARAQQLCRFLQQHGWPADVIAGALDQKERFAKMAALRNFNVRVLITSDLLSRGIDIDRLTGVVHLDVPDDRATFLHRTGRAGRYGTIGFSVCLFTAEEAAQWREWTDIASMATELSPTESDYSPLCELKIEMTDEVPPPPFVLKSSSSSSSGSSRDGSESEGESSNDTKGPLRWIPAPQYACRTPLFLPPDLPF